MEYKYDVALSFANEDRIFVNEVAQNLQRFGKRVYYDEFDVVDSWGKNLYDHLGDIYKNQSKFVVIFISKAYAQKMWTKYEREKAMRRVVVEKREYILPAKFDDTEIPNITNAIAYIDLKNYTPLKFSWLLFDKIVDYDSKMSQVENKVLASRLKRKRLLNDGLEILIRIAFWGAVIYILFFYKQ